MEEQRKGKVTAAYLSVKRYEIGLYIFMLGIFGVLFILARLPMVFYWYGVELSAFFFLIFMGLGYIHYAKRYRAFQFIEYHPLATLKEAADTIDPAEVYLRQEVSHLLEQLHEIELLQQEKNAEQMDYFTLWLHQIKTPIAAMSLLLQQQQDNPEWTRKAKQELLRIEEYTHMALNYLKLEQRGKDLNLEKVQLDNVIKKALKKFSISFVYNQISLEYEELHATTLSDEQWLLVMLEQILSNSLKYTPKKGTITIKLNPENPNQLVIEDTGMGIRAEDLPRIFEKGYSGWNGKAQEKSTGLGLFLSKRISQRLGHPIKVQSELDKGTRIFIDFTQQQLEIFS